jgi:heterotetrameric sarcosine oxidase gamma subunit
VSERPHGGARRARSESTERPRGGARRARSESTERPRGGARRARSESTQQTLEPLARSPITPAPPVVTADGWEVSGRRASAALTLTDCTPLTKVQLRAPAHGKAAAALGVRFGHAARDGAGTLVVGSGPGEWLLIAPPAKAQDLGAERIAEQAPGELVTWLDITHGRAMMRLSGPEGASVLAKLCGIDLGEGISPDGAAFRTSVAALATDVIRDDLVSADERTRSYLLHCERSSGQYLFDAVLRAGAEFAIEIDGFQVPSALPARPDPPQ